MIEPHAGARTLAREVHQIFIALMQEGFTEAQALNVIASVLIAGGKGDS